MYVNPTTGIIHRHIQYKRSGTQKNKQRVPNEKVVLIEELHLPHAQPSELVEVSEENENRLGCCCSAGVDDGLLIEMYKEAVLQAVDRHIVVRMLGDVSGCMLMSAACRMIG